LAAPAGSTAVLNAANEVAVAAFLAGAIRFDQIHAVNEYTIEHARPERGEADALEGLLGLDARSRAVAQAHARALAP
jgi:1-deoxy-D-xylulose-5-phosphate reductoisomerase